MQGGRVIARPGAVPASGGDNQGGTAGIPARPCLRDGLFCLEAIVIAELDRVERTYNRLGRRWAWNVLSFAGFQGRESMIRRRAVERLELRPGDAVLDVACGRGSNFPYLERAVGEEGRLVGTDYSRTMLAGAEALVRQRRWPNVTLVRQDAAEIAYNAEFDGAICTNAMSVIPRWEQTLTRMAAAVRPGRRLVIVDGKLSEGIGRIANPYARLFARIVAADLNRDIPGACRTLLGDLREETLLFGTYFIVSGTPGTTAG